MGTQYGTGPLGRKRNKQDNVKCHFGKILYSAWPGLCNVFFSSQLLSIQSGDENKLALSPLLNSQALSKSQG